MTDSMNIDREKAEHLHSAEPAKDSRTLDVDILKAMLDAKLPAKNKVSDEAYSELLENLLVYHVTTTDQLQSIIKTHLSDALRKDAEIASGVLAGSYPCPPEVRELVAKRGLYLAHAGLLRQMLSTHLGHDWTDWYAKRRRSRTKKNK